MEDTEGGHRRLAPTLVAAAATGLFIGMPHGGFMIWFAALGLGFWSVFALWRGWRRPDERSHRVAQLTIWTLALASALGVHAWREHASRQAADRIVAAVTAYRSTQGGWPPLLQDVGTEAEREAFHRWRGAYFVREGEPRLFYFSTWEPFSAYHYDFASKDWEFSGG